MINLVHDDHEEKLSYYPSVVATARDLQGAGVSSSLGPFIAVSDCSVKEPQVKYVGVERAVTVSDNTVKGLGVKTLTLQRELNNGKLESNCKASAKFIGDSLNTQRSVVLVSDDPDNYGALLLIYFLIT